jgi:hypothetical protein
LSQLLQVHEDAGVAFLPVGRKAEVGAEHEVDGVLAQPVLGHRDARALATEHVAEVARLVQEAERVHVAGRLDDRQVDRGGILHGTGLRES